MEQFIAFLFGGLFFSVVIIATNYKYRYLPIDIENKSHTKRN